jgi:hypothetical protein
VRERLKSLKESVLSENLQLVQAELAVNKDELADTNELLANALKGKAKADAKLAFFERLVCPTGQKMATGFVSARIIQNLYRRMVFARKTARKAEAAAREVSASIIQRRWREVFNVRGRLMGELSVFNPGGSLFGKFPIFQAKEEMIGW